MRGACSGRPAGEEGAAEAGPLAGSRSLSAPHRGLGARAGSPPARVSRPGAPRGGAVPGPASPAAPAPTPGAPGGPLASRGGRRGRSGRPAPARRAAPREAPRWVSVKMHRPRSLPPSPRALLARQAGRQRGPGAQVPPRPSAGPGHVPPARPRPPCPPCAWRGVS